MQKRFGLLILLFSLLIATTSFPEESYACSCAELPSVKVAVERGAAVFAGKVTNLDRKSGLLGFSSADPVTVTFEVYETWKGPNSSTIEVVTAAYEESCGFEFEVGEEYLVYAYEHEGKLGTGFCTRTTELSNARADLFELKDGKKPISDTFDSSDRKTSTLIFIIGGGMIIVLVALIYIKRKRFSK